MELYAHPFSSYCQKALIALYENATPFQFRLLTSEDGATMADFGALWPIKRFPILVEAGRTVLEASIIIEYLDLHHPGAVRLIPPSPQDALAVRMMDRVFDNYVMAPMQKIVLDRIRPEDQRDRHGLSYYGPSALDPGVALAPLGAQCKTRRRQVAGGSPTRRLKAREKAASDS